MTGIVALDHKPPNVRGRGFRHLRYRVIRDDPDGSRLLFGPVVTIPDTGAVVPDPTRRVGYINVNPATVIETRAGKGAS